MKVISLFVFLAALLVSVVLANKKERFSHAELIYPAGQYSSLNAVSIIKIYLLP